VNERTRLVLFNSPHNPACTTATGADLDALARLIHDRDIVVLSDEVYEHVVFRRRSAQFRADASGARAAELCGVLLRQDPARHRCAASGTAWRHRHSPASCARCTSTTPSASRIRCNTLIAAYLAERPDCGRELAGFFQAKRDRLRRALTPSGFSLPPAQGTYFQLLDFSAFSARDDVDFAEQLLTQARVATIPLSPFYASPQAFAVRAAVHCQTGQYAR